MLEIELKLVLTNSFDAAIFLKKKLLEELETQRHILHSTYFDTPQASLQQHKMAFRIRQAAGFFTQTIKKSVVDSTCTLQKNFEWNAALSQLSPDLSKIIDQNLRRELAILLKNTVLLPLFVTNFSRQTWFYTSDCGTCVEIAFDQGFILCGELRTEICEIELELKRGTNEHVLYDLAKQLSKGINVSSDVSSKAKRGYALAHTLKLIQ